jgi:hypothetical protein
VKVIKFSTKTRLASPLFTKEKHISNDYDSFLDANDIEICDDECGDRRQSHLSISNVYSQDSFSLSPEDVLFTDTEFYSCKLKEMTNKGANILDALEDELTDDVQAIHLEIHHKITNSYKCVRHVITSELPIYVLDYPMVTNKTKTVSSASSVTSPAVMSKVRRGDKVSVFCVKELPNSSTSWLLLNSGWIPNNASKPDVETPFQLPCKLVLVQPHHEAKGIGGENTQGEGEIVLVECLYEASRCKGKSVPFRRHFKSNLTEFNPLSYDKSSDTFSTVPM